MKRYTWQIVNHDNNAVATFNSSYGPCRKQDVEHSVEVQQWLNGANYSIIPGEQ